MWAFLSTNFYVFTYVYSFCAPIDRITGIYNHDELTIAWLTCECRSCIEKTSRHFSGINESFYFSTILLCYLFIFSYGFFWHVTYYYLFDCLMTYLIHFLFLVKGKVDQKNPNKLENVNTGIFLKIVFFLRKSRVCTVNFSLSTRVESKRSMGSVDGSDVQSRASKWLKIKTRPTRRC